MNQLRFFRTVAIAEGISFLVLLAIAMPLKFLMEIPEPVKVVGWLHGILFILYIPSAIAVKKTMQWSFISLGVALAASLVPLGTFILDKQLKKKEQELKGVEVV